MSHRVTVARGAHSPHHAFTGIPALFKAGRRGRPALVARADRLHAVPQAELAQDATEAGLHGALREEQPRLRPSTYTSRPTAPRLPIEQVSVRCVTKALRRRGSRVLYRFRSRLYRFR